MPPKYRNADWLEARYHGDGWTQREMADACGVSPRTIWEWMKRHDIETRDVEGENHPLYGESRDESVRERISETMEGREFAEETRRKISEANKGREIEEDTKRKISESLTGHTRSDRTRRRMSESTAGPDNPNWRGGYSSRYGAGGRRHASRRSSVTGLASTVVTTAERHAWRSITSSRSADFGNHRMPT